MMMKSSPRTCLFLVAAIHLPASAVMHVKGEEPASIAPDLAAIETWAKQFVAKPTTDIILPDPQTWFAGHFEKGIADKLAAEYIEGAKGANALPMAIEKQRATGKSVVRVSGYSKAIDMKANGLQNAALQRMTTPVTLYKLELLEPGHESGWSLWSFVLIDGKYYFVGKMAALSPTHDDMVTKFLCQMPLGTAESLLQEKELLKGGAVEYLTEKGVLVGG